MVHDLVPRALYEHPIVEYIPLLVTDIAFGDVPPEFFSPDRTVRPSLHVLASEGAWRSAVEAFGFAFPPLQSVPELDSRGRNLTILALGLRVVAGIYRGHKVSLAVDRLGPTYHLFGVPSWYFYKPVVDFVAYTQHGARLAEARGVPVPTGTGGET